MATAGAGTDELRQKCWDQAVEAFGTARIFERRAGGLQTKLQILAYLGFCGPLAVGLVALGFGANNLTLVLPLAAALGLLQGLVAFWALVRKWVDSYTYAVKSAAANDRLASAYSDLASTPPADQTAFRHAYDLLWVEDQQRRTSDGEQNVSEREKRYGMRAALRRFRRECVGCHQVPLTLDSTSCGVCGNF